MELLQHFGLTKKEAEIYQHLLRLGESPISNLLKATGAHPQVVYRAINSLEKKELLTIVIRKNKKYIRAESPKELERQAEEKLSALQAALPDLLALQKDSDEAIVRISRGDEAIRNVRLRAIKEMSPGQTYYIIGASGDRYYDIMGQIGPEFERKRIKKRIKKKLLTFTSQRLMLEKMEAAMNLRTYAEFRFLPGHHPIPSSTNIFNDTVAILVWSKDPIAIAIESHEIAESYHQYFNELWKIAKA